MKAESVIILILVFSLITIAVGGIIGDMRDTYDINASTSWEDKYSFTDEINSSISGIAEDTKSAGTESGWLSVLSGASAIFQATVSAVFLILNVPGYLISIIRGVASDFGLPPVVSDVIIPIFIIMIIVSLVFMIIRMIRGENI